MWALFRASAKVGKLFSSSDHFTYYIPLYQARKFKKTLEIKPAGQICFDLSLVSLR